MAAKKATKASATSKAAGKTAGKATPKAPTGVRAAAKPRVAGPAAKPKAARSSGGALARTTGAKGGRVATGSVAERAARISDEAVQKSTGKSWEEWFALLAEADAPTMTHAQIAALLHREHGLSGWWSQMVTVAYERSIGRRVVNQTSKGDYQASGSRTFAVPVEELFAAWQDERLRKKWLPEKGVTLRTSTPHRSFRMTWSDGRTSIAAWFVSKGPAKSQVSVDHRKLAAAKDVAPLRAYWKERLAALAELLGG